jgi:uncharacterized DUF497 family protein
MAVAFEWDHAKDLANQRKHEVAFNEASTVFGDPLAWFQPDAKHSQDEERLLLLGRSSANRLLAVLFTDRGADLIRVISARPATPRERRKYEKDFR